MVEEKLSGEEWVLINPHCADYGRIYADIQNKYKGKTSKYIDFGDEEIIRDIEWFPTYKWSIKND